MKTLFHDISTYSTMKKLLKKRNSLKQFAMSLYSLFYQQIFHIIRAVESEQKESVCVFFKGFFRDRFRTDCIGDAQVVKLHLASADELIGIPRIMNSRTDVQIAFPAAARETILSRSPILPINS